MDSLVSSSISLYLRVVCVWIICYEGVGLFDLSVMRFGSLNVEGNEGVCGSMKIGW